MRKLKRVLISALGLSKVVRGVITVSFLDYFDNISYLKVLIHADDSIVYQIEGDFGYQSFRERAEGATGLLPSKFNGNYKSLVEGICIQYEEVARGHVIRIQSDDIMDFKEMIAA